ncbi:MAG: DJ-1/PfpI family protein [Clostridia bacterium]|nr:DJ-1/PfpI family protein [Clostridia bacterium]
MIYVFLANGFEEIEALATIDILRRCEIDVTTVGVGSQDVRGAHGITVLSDTVDSLIVPTPDIDAIVLPGGMPGTLNLEKSKAVQGFIDYAISKNILVGAICAAPSILGHKGLLKGKKATCFPGFEEQLYDAQVVADGVVQDGNIITAKGAGCSFDFALAIAKCVVGEHKSNSVRMSMQCVK